MFFSVLSPGRACTQSLGLKLDCFLIKFLLVLCSWDMRDAYKISLNYLYVNTLGFVFFFASFVDIFEPVFGGFANWAKTAGGNT